MRLKIKAIEQTISESRHAEAAKAAAKSLLRCCEESIRHQLGAKAVEAGDREKLTPPRTMQLNGSLVTSMRVQVHQKGSLRTETQTVSNRHEDIDGSQVVCQNLLLPTVTCPLL